MLSRHNKSYADTNISYSYRKGSSISTKSYSYGTAFKEKTTVGEKLSCNSFANCYVGCSCQSGWTQGEVPSSGEYVWAKDNRYTGVNSMSAGGSDNVGALSKGASTQSANSNAQVVSLNGSVSTMGSSGGMTCYKAACDSGYYLDTPNSTYFKSTSKTGTIGLTCYKATGCQSGYYNGGSSQDYHGYKCSKCTYSCPSGYYEAGSTWSDYKLTSTSTHKVCNGDSSQTNNEVCYTRTLKTCSDYGYKASIPSGMTCSSVTPRSGLTCYKDCKSEVYFPDTLLFYIDLCSSGVSGDYYCTLGPGSKAKLIYGSGNPDYQNGYYAKDFEIIGSKDNSMSFVIACGSTGGSSVSSLGPIGNLSLSYGYYSYKNNYSAISPTKLGCKSIYNSQIDTASCQVSVQRDEHYDWGTYTLKHIPTGKEKDVTLTFSENVYDRGQPLSGGCDPNNIIDY